ncbi:MAG TPA: hypothetical protein VGO78_00845 [Acidimicrobiales bacterium]|nr:hypothetical protein [Acidimicrobiales bacterium]
MATDDAPEIPEFDLDDLGRAIGAVYGGALDGFVARRDALVKQLRAAKRTDDAGTVKALRKPRVNAWALDALALAQPDETERLASAVATMAEAQSGRGGDVRQATAQLRAVVNEVAAAATRLAAEAGHKIDQANLVPALLVVVGETEALAELRAGRLVDIPTASGMGLLAAAPPGARAASLYAVPDLPADDADGAPPVDAKAVAAAQRKLDDAESTMDTAQAVADTADDAVRDAEGDAEAAEDRLRQAEEDVRDARTTLREAQRDARTAAQRRRETERATARARAALDALLARRTPS